MLFDGMSYWKFSISIAMACCKRSRPAEGAAPRSVAAYVCNVLEIATGRHLDVQLMRYRVTTKIPLLLTDGDGTNRLFWYYPTQTDAEFAESLAEMLCDLPISHACATA